MITRCIYCKRVLTSPKSIDNGFGSYCRKKYLSSNIRQQRLFDYGFDKMIVLKKKDNTTSNIEPTINVELEQYNEKLNGLKVISNDKHQMKLVNLI